MNSSERNSRRDPLSLRTMPAPLNQVCKLMPSGQIESVAYFRTSCKLTRFLYFYVVGKKSKEYFVARENYMQFKFQCP